MSLNRSASIWPKWLVFLVVLTVCTFASAQKQKPHSSPPPAPHASKPAPPPKPAPQSAPHPAPSNQSHGTNPSHGTNAGGANTAHGGNTAGGANNAHPTNTGHSGNTAGGSSASGANAARGNAAGGNNNNAHGGPNNAKGANAAGGNNNNNAHGGPNNAKGANAAGGNNNNAHGGPNNAKGANAAGGNNNNAKGAMAGHRGPPTTTKEIKTRSGATVQASYRGGHVRTIQAHNMKIERGFRGERRVVTERNGRRIVTVGRGRGYMQRPYYNRGGRAYYQRTYYYGGRRYAYAYRGYYYHGARYYGYAPAYYYRPAYYGWAYRPWPAPASYRWGYYNDPWYGQYNYYYQPYPTYPSASPWVTDYMMSEYLRQAYEARLNGQAAPGPMSLGSQDLWASLWPSDALVAANLKATYGGMFYAAGNASQAQLTPEVKQLLADEVKLGIEEEQAAAGKSQAAAAAAKGGDETPPALDPKHRTFIVASDLDVTRDDGKECGLSQGDVIQRSSDDVSDDNNVDIVVKASKKDDCAVGTKASVEANDVQEMYNHFRETMDAGMKALAENSGKNGLPAAPDTTTTAGEVPAPAADTNVETELQQQQKDADQTEAEVPQDGGGQ